MKAKSQKIQAKGIMIAAFAFSFSSLLFLTGCDEKFKDQAESSELALVQQQESYAQAIASRDSMIDEMLASFDAIDANLDVIRDKEKSLQEWQPGEEILGKREDRIVRDIKLINTLMADNDKEIAKLRERLRKSGVNMAALETRLNHLEMENQAQSEQLASLKESLAQAEVSLANLNDTLSHRDLRIAMQSQVIDAQSQVIVAQDSKMHEAYLATGSYKELKERGLVEKKGALLGVIGGEKAFTANTDSDEYVTIDQREHMRIPIFAKKPELITPHPEGSYTFEKDEDGKVAAIEILDPEEFWQSSRYLIVATD